MLKILETVPERKVPSTLDELAGEGACRMLMEALDAEVADYVGRHRAERGLLTVGPWWSATAEAGRGR